MTERTPFMAGNWKMNLDRKGGLALAAELRDRVGDRKDVEVAIFPPAVYIDELARALAGSPVRVGGQDCCEESSGAFTGEVSAAMLADSGAELVIVGHSERRHVYGETDEQVAKKVRQGLDAGLDVILCVGELLEEREAGQTQAVVRRQTSEGLKLVNEGEMARLVVAYEPVWAIGTGHTASPAQAGEVHSDLREFVAGLHGAHIAQSLRIQYGGSVNPANVAELMSVPDVDGALVGGASLSAEKFIPIIEFDHA
ncbi:MAG: triose-phosphate isomerase [Planctomycetes bacterium]|nr:triose-phosphate isomerase [Planctomycetota bacterium]